MLTAALPGVRDVRTPLIVGYGYLLTLWLLVYEYLPQDLSELEDSAPALAGLIRISSAAAVVVISFLAYIFGGFAVVVTARMLKISGPPIEVSPQDSPRRRLGQLFSFTSTPEINDLDLRLAELVDGEMNKISKDRRSHLEEETSLPVGASRLGFRIRRHAPQTDIILPPAIRVRVEAKSGRIDDRILAKSFNLFNELSRSRNEADLKAGLIPVVFVLALTIVLRQGWPPWVNVAVMLIALLAMVGLFLEALTLRGRVREIAIRAVVDGLVSTPTLDLIRRRAAELQAPTSNRRAGRADQKGPKRRR